MAFLRNRFFLTKTEKDIICPGVDSIAKITLRTTLELESCSSISFGVESVSSFGLTPLRTCILSFSVPVPMIRSYTH